MSGWAFAAAANSGGGSNWRVSCSSADSALSWVAGSVTARSLGRHTDGGNSAASCGTRLRTELVYVRKLVCAETRASGWLRWGKRQTFVARSPGYRGREAGKGQVRKDQRPRR